MVLKEGKEVDLLFIAMCLKGENAVVLFTLPVHFASYGNIITVYQRIYSLLIARNMFMWLTTIVAITKHIFFCFGIVQCDIAICEPHSATKNNTTKCKASSLCIDSYIIYLKEGRCLQMWRKQCSTWILTPIKGCEVTICSVYCTVTRCQHSNTYSCKVEFPLLATY